jgi:hypothetical protein
MNENHGDETEMMMMTLLSDDTANLNDDDDWDMKFCEE